MSEVDKVSRAVDQAIAALLFAREVLNTIPQAQVGECRHPAIARRNIATFASEQTFLCTMCDEVVTVEHE